MMRNLLLTVTVLLGMLYGCSRDTIERPNIIWIIAEDLSQDLGIYGNDLIDTPHINLLARKGVKFNHVFTTSPVCTPSRTALAVGMYQTTIGAHHMRYPDSLKPALPPGVHTMMDEFHQNGYVTASIADKPGTGKTDWSFKADLSKQFDYKHWQKLFGQDKPFFAQISISNTHRPFPEEKTNAGIIEKIKIPPYYPDNIVTREDWAGYYRSAEMLDQKVGQVLATLKEHNADHNTIVFFFSDHGRPMPRGKTWNYDSGIQIPVIIYIPEGLESPEEYQPGRADDRLISSIDLTATTLALAGIPKPKYMQGRVFWGENRDPDREYVYSATDRVGEIYFKSRAVRSRRFKYIRNFNRHFSVNSASTAYRKANQPIYHVLNILHEEGSLTSAQEQLVIPLPYEELYDLKEDPCEMNNLVSDDRYRTELKIFRKELDDWIKRTADKGMEPDSAEIISVFRKYGEDSYNQRKEKIQQLYERIRKQLNRR